jgi:hypothetical protein
MERRLRARVELQAVDTGDVAFLYCVELQPGVGISPVFGLSFPLEQATTFREDVEKYTEAFFGGDEDGMPLGGVYDPFGASIMAHTLFGRRPLAVAYMEDIVGFEPSSKVTRIECVSERWEYYCAEARESEV